LEVEAAAEADTLFRFRGGRATVRLLRGATGAIRAVFTPTIAFVASDLVPFAGLTGVGAETAGTSETTRFADEL
jgi:hypothetical protein